MENLNRISSSDDEVMTPLFKREDVLDWIESLKPASITETKIEIQDSSTEQ
jgi:hypothetical protein